MLKAHWISAAIGLTLSSLPSATSAGPRDSGGGNSLVCFDNPSIPGRIRSDLSSAPKSANFSSPIKSDDLSHITSIELLDLFEARLPELTLRGKRLEPMQLVEILPTEQPFEYATRIVERSRDIVPDFYARVKTSLEFLGDARSLNYPAGIVPYDDTQFLGSFDTQNCVIVTVARQQALSRETVFAFDQRLWNHTSHSKMSQGATLLHEAIYNAYLGDTTAPAVRKMVAVLLEKNIRVTDFKEKTAHLGFANSDSMTAMEEFLAKIPSRLYLQVNIQAKLASTPWKNIFGPGYKKESAQILSFYRSVFEDYRSVYLERLREQLFSISILSTQEKNDFHNSILTKLTPTDDELTSLDFVKRTLDPTSPFTGFYYPDRKMIQNYLKVEIPNPIVPDNHR